MFKRWTFYLKTQGAIPAKVQDEVYAARGAIPAVGIVCCKSERHREHLRGVLAERGIEAVDTDWARKPYKPIDRVMLLNHLDRVTSGSNTFSKLL